ncbi:MAG: thioredoxin domain-containing protein, partial [Desulfovibrionales bacterium]
MKAKHTNRLAQEKSPYLLQHAHNPVDWFPWGEAAFGKAAAEDKPVFLSIGYSTCHWCHVMERESFEDEEVAELMNQTFVCIKVDREERPDIDSVYMSVCTMMTGSGGWPLTIIMTPDRKPFFAATYLPKQSGFGRVGMMDLVPSVDKLWRENRHKAIDAADHILSHVGSLIPPPSEEDLDPTVLDACAGQLEQMFDGRRGGFGQAPKFPSPQNLLFLLRYYNRTGRSAPKEMVDTTLTAMRLGGIWDQVGFGFHRYSTDADWLLPHFEKMLYDQGMLALAYLEAFGATGKQLFARTAEEIFAYVLRDMRSPEGAFFSAEDADSEGVEGKFYVWSRKEFRDTLSGLDADFWEQALQVRQEGNFLEEATRERTGDNILHFRKPLEDLAREHQRDPSELAREWEDVRQKLFNVREQRIRPHLDDKILTDWNGIMIAALAYGGRVLGRDDYIVAADVAADFLLTTMRTKDKTLLHRFRQGEAAVDGFADDYAYFIWALIELYQATFNPYYLQSALELQQSMLELFWDEEAHGFYFTPAAGEQLPFRPKEVFDGPYPSANSVGLANLLKLSRMTGDHRMGEKAGELARSYSSTVRSQPAAYPHFLSAMDMAFGPTREVVLTGSLEDPATQTIRSAVDKTYSPNTVFLHKSEQNAEAMNRLAPYLKEITDLSKP